MSPDRKAMLVWAALVRQCHKHHRNADSIAYWATRGDEQCLAIITAIEEDLGITRHGP